jgi:hypothetical protein
MRYIIQHGFDPKVVIPLELEVYETERVMRFGIDLMISSKRRVC